MIREEVGDNYFCILVDEAQDISKQEQIAIILRFVNDRGILTEYLFAIKSVGDTTSLNLRKEICGVMSHHVLRVEKMRDKAKDVGVVWEFISHLDNVVNIITSSPKRVTQFHDAQRLEIQRLLVVEELDSGCGSNQIGNQRAGATRWSSHYNSVKSLIDMYVATCKIIQRKVQDILAAIAFVSITKAILQELRENGWEGFLEEVNAFCLKNDIMSLIWILHIRLVVLMCKLQLNIIIHFDVFNSAIDCILIELNTRFIDVSVELLYLSVALDPKNYFESFNSDDIFKLARKVYPADFTDQDIVSLEFELRHYKQDVMVMQEFQVSTLVELSQQLSKSGRSMVYVMLTRLINLILTLHVSTSTTKQAFSAMKHVKTALRNKMGDDLLEDSLMLYI